MAGRLAIFDCDGVLVDTERITTRLLAEMVTELGIPTTVEDAVRDFKGRDLHLIQADLEEELGRGLGAGWIESYRARMFEAFEAGVPLIDGARELVEAAMPSCCVASNGPRSKMEASLGASGLFGLLSDRMFSAYEVGAWKPEPGLFLHAAEAMGAEPGACVVVEDSASGVEAARRAGMRAIGFADLSPREKLEAAGAHEVFGDLASVRGAVGSFLLG